MLGAKCEKLQWLLTRMFDECIYGMLFISTSILNTRLQSKHTHHQYLQNAIKFTDRKNGHFLKPGKNNNQTNRSKLKWIKVLPWYGRWDWDKLRGTNFP